MSVPPLSTGAETSSSTTSRQCRRSWRSCVSTLSNSSSSSKSCGRCCRRGTRSACGSALCTSSKERPARGGATPCALLQSGRRVGVLVAALCSFLSSFLPSSCACLLLLAVLSFSFTICTFFCFLVGWAHSDCFLGCCHAPLLPFSLQLWTGLRCLPMPACLLVTRGLHLSRTKVHLLFSNLLMRPTASRPAMGSTSRQHS